MTGPAEGADGSLLSSTSAVTAAQTGSEFMGAVAGALGGGGGGGGGDSGGGGCTQNTPSINIIDNARIMMLPGSVPGMMAQS